MAKIIDAREILINKSLPIEGFFVDTNIVINFKDPFQVSGELIHVAETNNLLREILPKFKTDGGKCFSTYSVALEYYKYIQVNYTKKFTGNANYSTKDYKSLRDNNPEFQSGWVIQLKAFDKVFRKNFPIKTELIPTEDCRESFKSFKTDFGDHLLYSSVKNVDKKICCIFTDDIDFIQYPDDLIILTTNNKILQQTTKN